MSMTKDYLVKITGIGESYAEDILEVYGTYEDVILADVTEIENKTGLPENTARKLKNRIKSLYRLYRLENEKKDVIDERIEEIEEKIPQLEDRETVNPNNTTPKEHLKNLLETLQNDPDTWVDNQIRELERIL